MLDLAQFGLCCSMFLTAAAQATGTPRRRSKCILETPMNLSTLCQALLFLQPQLAHRSFVACIAGVQYLLPSCRSAHSLMATSCVP
jgi:hypothetical protein